MSSYDLCEILGKENPSLIPKVKEFYNAGIVRENNLEGYLKFNKDFEKNPGKLNELNQRIFAKKGELEFFIQEREKLSPVERGHYKNSLKRIQKEISKLKEEYEGKPYEIKKISKTLKDLELSEKYLKIDLDFLSYERKHNQFHVPLFAVFNYLSDKKFGFKIKPEFSDNGKGYSLGNRAFIMDELVEVMFDPDNVGFSAKDHFLDKYHKKILKKINKVINKKVKMNPREYISFMNSEKMRFKEESEFEEERDIIQWEGALTCDPLEGFIPKEIKEKIKESNKIFGEEEYKNVYIIAEAKNWKLNKKKFKLVPNPCPLVVRISDITNQAYFIGAFNLTPLEQHALEAHVSGKPKLN